MYIASRAGRSCSPYSARARAWKSSRVAVSQSLGSDFSGASSGESRPCSGASARNCAGTLASVMRGGVMLRSRPSSSSARAWVSSSGRPRKRARKSSRSAAVRSGCAPSTDGIQVCRPNIWFTGSTCSGNCWPSTSCATCVRSRARFSRASGARAWASMPSITRSSATSSASISARVLALRSLQRLFWPGKPVKVADSGCTVWLQAQ